MICMSSGLQATPRANRKQITFYGRTNAGKSSLFNAIVGQEVAIVSEMHGTTTDSVSKAMEFIPYGPVLFVDTAGINDQSSIGALRIQKTYQELKKSDLAIYVVGGDDLDFTSYESFRTEFKKYNIPHLLVLSKADVLTDEEKQQWKQRYPQLFLVNSTDGNSVLALKQELLALLAQEEEDPSLMKGLVDYGGCVVLVVPIDSEAPKGRLILPQVQVIRDCLDHGIKTYVVRDSELEQALLDLPSVDLVITDSQAFKTVDQIVKKRIPLTSFSILFARQKGDFQRLVEGTRAVATLPEHAKILIVETCTHNTSHEDIGRVKIPMLLKKVTGKEFIYTFVSGPHFPEDVATYDVVVHCGGCMISRKNMVNRMNFVQEQHVPITNYGMLLAYLTNTFEQAIAMFETETN